MVLIPNSLSPPLVRFDSQSDCCPLHGDLMVPVNSLVYQSVMMIVYFHSHEIFPFFPKGSFYKPSPLKRTSFLLSFRALTLSLRNKTIVCAYLVIIRRLSLPIGVSAPVRTWVFVSWFWVWVLGWVLSGSFFCLVVLFLCSGFGG